MERIGIDFNPESKRDVHRHNYIYYIIQTHKTTLLLCVATHANSTIDVCSARTVYNIGRPPEHQIDKTQP